MGGKFLNDWSDSSLREMASEFVEYGYGDNRDDATDEFISSELAGAEILLASYTYECYSGSAFVLFRKGGKLYEVHGNHCSCYGLEGQWEPEETTAESLTHRLACGGLGTEYSGENVFADELREVLSGLAA